MALSNKPDIETELQHSMMLPEEVEVVMKDVLNVADSVDDDDLQKMQQLLQMIVDAEYEEPDLL